MNIFAKAAKIKLRFNTSHGVLSVEQLWDLSQAKLAVIIKNLREDIKAADINSDADLAFLDQDLKKALTNTTFKSFLFDNVEFSINEFNRTFDKLKLNEGFIRYQKYGRKDVCRILNWETDLTSTVYGYKTVNGLTPCFVTYKKSDDISDSTKYNDHFISPKIFGWESKSNRKVDSSEIQKILDSKRILLFVKKEDGEGTDFYYLGDVTVIDGSVEQALMQDNKTPIVHFKFELDQPV